MNARREFLAEAPLGAELAGIHDWGLLPVLTRPAVLRVSSPGGCLQLCVVTGAGRLTSACSCRARLPGREYIPFVRLLMIVNQASLRRAGGRRARSCSAIR